MRTITIPLLTFDELDLPIQSKILKNFSSFYSVFSTTMPFRSLSENILIDHNYDFYYLVNLIISSDIVCQQSEYLIAQTRITISEYNNYEILPPNIRNVNQFRIKVRFLEHLYYEIKSEKIKYGLNEKYFDKDGTEFKYNEYLEYSQVNENEIL